MSNRTKFCRDRYFLYTILSWILCFGVTLMLVIYGFKFKWTGEATETVKRIKSALTTLLVAILPLIIITIFVKDKIKPTMRMINLILTAIVINVDVMYIMAVLMLIDTYVITRLAAKYKISWISNKEIDKREQATNKEALNGESNTV